MIQVDFPGVKAKVPVPPRNKIGTRSRFRSVMITDFIDFITVFKLIQSRVQAQYMLLQCVFPI